MVFCTGTTSTWYFPWRIFMKDKSIKVPDWKADDARLPTEHERQGLSRLMYLAFCDLRGLAIEARAAQAKDLAEAFHNIPLLMYTADFSFKAFRGFLDHYQQKYAGKLSTDYLKEWEK